MGGNKRVIRLILPYSHYGRLLRKLSTRLVPARGMLMQAHCIVYAEY